MKVKHFIVILIVFMIGCGCAKSEVIPHDEHFYRFTGDLMSVVESKNNSFNELGILSIVTVSKSIPTLDQFKDYKMYNGAPEDFINITKRTVIYRRIDDQHKQLINPVELELHRGKQIEYWVKPLNNHTELLEAIEITLLN